MRALLFAALLVTTGLAVVPQATASPCGGTVDVDCDTGYCSVYFFDGIRPQCIKADPAYCIVYVDALRGDINRSPLVCVVV